ncbi:hypothetical protein AYJ05_07200 [Corynebacterium stationis]|uniref:Secreted protein n=2 Tax=Corynebacterium stationis TaxID=1705 RepID=A0A177I866_9CORY|nr:hypothetical protein AYJ05_07200 [Corynebacterium stationis]
MKLSAAALALVTPFALVACGSDESEETAAPSTSAVTSTVEATSSKETSSVETTTSKAKETSEEAEPTTPTTQTPAETQEPESGQGTDPAAAAGAADAAAGNPLAAEELQPVQGGQPADEATRGAISKLVNGWYEVGDMRSYMRYIPEHTCTQVLEQNPDVHNVDYSVFPQIPMNQVSDNWNAAGVQSIDDLAVNGDTASATVTVNTGEGVDTSVMRFKNESGNWLFCN